MRKRRSFRPALSDCLEDRAVPSVASASVSGAYQPRTFNYAQVAGQVNQAFNSFRTDYNNQLATFLNSGTSTALAQLQSFDAQRINQLTQELQSALSQVPGTSGGLTPFLLGGVNGTTGGALLATLSGIPGNTGTNSGPSGLYGSIANAAINSAQYAANNVLSAYAWGLGSGQASYGTASPFTGANYTRLAGALNGAFGTFRNNYGSQLAGFVGSTVSPSQFQSSTALAGANLVQGLQGAYNGGTGMSTGLSPFVNGQVNGSIGGAMMSSLNGIPTNTGTNGGPDSLYSLAATNAINTAQLATNNMASAFTWGFNQGQGFVDAFARGGATPSFSTTASNTTGNNTTGGTVSGTAGVPTMYGSLTGITTSRGTTYGVGTGGMFNGGTTGGVFTGGGTMTGGTTTGSTTTGGAATGGAATGGTTTGTTTGAITGTTTGASTGSTNNTGNNGVSSGGFSTTGGTTTGGTTGSTLSGTSTGSTNNTGNNGVSSGGFANAVRGGTNMGNSGLYNPGPTNGMYNPGPTNGMYTGPIQTTTIGNRFPIL